MTLLASTQGCPGVAAAPAGHLLEFILGFLAPLLMTGSIVDLQLARLAATEAVCAYQARGSEQLLSVAQIVGFALAALDDLRLSVDSEQSLPMKLQLRSNAGVLNRAVALTTRTLDKARDVAERVAAVELDEADPVEVPPMEAPAPAAVEPVAAEQRDQSGWADAMKTQAARLRAGAGLMSAAERKKNGQWADVLNDVAGELSQGTSAGTGMNKAELMRTTLLAGGGFPDHLLGGGRVAPKRSGRG